jgi:metal-sulfur cluster biosynthetic enzyme
MDKENVLQKLSEIKHPAIDYSLIKLGILTDIQLENNELKVVFAFPFPNIPIADVLISSVATKAEEINLSFNYSIRIMNEEEREKFLQLESEAWKGL